MRALQECLREYLGDPTTGAQVSILRKVSNAVTKYLVRVLMSWFMSEAPPLIATPYRPAASLFRKCASYS